MIPRVKGFFIDAAGHREDIDKTYTTEAVAMSAFKTYARRTGVVQGFIRAELCGESIQEPCETLASKEWGEF